MGREMSVIYDPRLRSVVQPAMECGRSGQPSKVECQAGRQGQQFEEETRQQDVRG